MLGGISMDFAYECRFDILMQGPCQSSLYHSNFIHHISCRGSLPRVGLDHGISDLSVHLNMQLDTLSGHQWTYTGGHLVVDMVDTWWTFTGGHSLVDIHWWTNLNFQLDIWQTHSRHLLFGCENMCGKCLGHVWEVSGTCLGHVWKVFGKCLGHV